MNSPYPIYFIPHGGGPMPLLGEPSHQPLVKFLADLGKQYPNPKAVLVISAHWETEKITISAKPKPDLLYDYYGFPDEAYNLDYALKPALELSRQIQDLLQTQALESELDEQRDFDHGVFIPLKLMYPQGGIPCVQISLMDNLDPQAHLNLGKALQGLREQEVLVLGSGYSFHNLATFSRDDPLDNEKNIAFENWLITSCTDNMPEHEREEKFIHWAEAPYAQFCHPREEHLIPLLVCYGIAGKTAQLAFKEQIMGKYTSGFKWE